MNTFTLKGGYLYFLCISIFLFHNNVSAAESFPPPNGTVYTTSAKLSNKKDDAEEKISNGKISWKDNQVEIVKNGNTAQLAGFRFRKVSIPQGAVIEKAYIQFKARGASNGSTNLIIHAEAADNSKPFKPKKYDLSDRAKSSSEVAWSPVGWAANEAGVAQQTADISALVQEVVDRPGWQVEKNMAFFFSGDGTRNAYAYDDCKNCSAELVVEFSITCAVASATSICQNQGDPGFYIDVNLGSGTNVSYSVTNSYDNTVTSIDLGSSVQGSGPFPNGTSVDLTVEADNYSGCTTTIYGLTESCVCDDFDLLESHFEKTTPFENTSISLKDGEGMTYVPGDGSLWLMDDNSPQIAEMDASNGTLKSIISESDLASTLELGGNTPAGINRAGDLEGGAYDANADILYVFSGNTGVNDIGTVFRLMRDNSGNFVPESFQSLALGTDDLPGAGYHPSDGLYTAKGKILRSYDFENNSFGNPVDLSGNGIAGSIYGMSFSDNGNVLWIVTSSDLIYKIDWNTITNTNITILDVYDLLALGIEDGRGVDMVNGQLCVVDGASNPSNPDKKFAVTYFDLIGGSGNGSIVAVNENMEIGQTAKRTVQNEKEVNENVHLHVFPNPANGWLNIHFDQKEETLIQLMVVDAFGKKVMRIENFKNQELDISNLPNGFYTIHLQFGKELMEAKSFIKF